MLINGISNPCRPANSPRLGWRGRRGRGRHHPGQERTKSPPGPNWHNGMSFITGPPFFTGRPSLPAPCAAHRGRGRKRLCHAQPRQTVVSQRWHRHASVFGSCLDTLYANIGLTSSLALFFFVSCGVARARPECGGTPREPSDSIYGVLLVGRALSVAYPVSTGREEPLYGISPAGPLPIGRNAGRAERGAAWYTGVHHAANCVVFRPIGFRGR